MIYFCECKIYVKNMLPETDFINRHIGPRKHQVKQMLLELQTNQQLYDTLLSIIEIELASNQENNSIN